jgi:hypothetical protein
MPFKRIYKQELSKKIVVNFTPSQYQIIQEYAELNKTDESTAIREMALTGLAEYYKSTGITELDPTKAMLPSEYS